MLNAYLKQHMHKGQFGYVGVLRGQKETAGASYLSAYAALRAGAGRVTMLCPKIKGNQTASPEIMHHLDEVFLKHNTPQLTSLIMGPGAGLQSKVYRRLHALMSHAAHKKIPMVIDADALSLLSIHESYFLEGASCIATPHPKEASYLLQCTPEDVQTDREGALKALCNLPVNKTNQIVWVLKGANPLVGELTQFTTCQGDTPTLAIAGSGDVLAGILGAVIPLAPSLYEAAVIGVESHLKAGVLLSQISQRGHLAHEIADALPAILWPPLSSLPINT